MNATIHLQYVNSPHKISSPIRLNRVMTWLCLLPPQWHGCQETGLWNPVDQIIHLAQILILNIKISMIYDSMAIILDHSKIRQEHDDKRQARFPKRRNNCKQCNHKLCRGMWKETQICRHKTLPRKGAGTMPKTAHRRKPGQELK